MAGTQLLSVTGEFCHGTEDHGVATPKIKSHGSEHSSLKHSWCQGGKQGKVVLQFKEAEDTVRWRPLLALQKSEVSCH